MKREIMHCADDLQDPGMLVALYSYKEDEERRLSYLDAASACLMLAYIHTPDRGWKTRLFNLSRTFAQKYLDYRRSLNVGAGI